MDPDTLNISNEWNPLQKVVVGHAQSMGKTPNLESAFDPTSKWHLSRGTYPKPQEVSDQLDGLAKTLENQGVHVLRPTDLEGVEQIFARDVGLVIDRTFIRSRTIDERSAEWEGVAPLLQGVEWIELPEGIHLEGGDTVVLDDAIALGVTRNPAWESLQVSRTNPPAEAFLQDLFPHREVLGIELIKDDTDPFKCALHLDCAYMPLGLGHAIACPEFFVNQSEFEDLMSRHTGVIELTVEEAALLQSNLLHLAPDTLLIDPGFDRVSKALIERGYNLIECPMDKVGRMGGLFRCTTLPLRRSL